MKPFQTILFGADFSEGSRAAFRAACSLAVAGETRIHVVHVIEPNWVPEEPVPYGQAVMGFYDAQSDGGRYEAIRRRMRDMYVPNAGPVDVEYHLKEGDAAAEILSIADQLRPDLIVVGTQRAHRVELAARGGASPPRSPRAPPAGPRRPTARSVRASTRRSGSSCIRPISRRVASGACASPLALARDVERRLVLFHVVPFGFYANEMTVLIDPTAYREALEEERQLIDGPDLKYPVETRLARGDAAEEILGRRGRARLRADRDGHPRTDRLEPSAHRERDRVRGASGGVPGAGREDAPARRGVRSGVRVAAPRDGPLTRHCDCPRRPPSHTGGSYDEHHGYPPH